ncbi:hypothetical protein FRC09_008197 [Ceratobasidium sp. 395]|nr:hypothetical protein FRC09_008197 [Ceratobasidium sp. 395]
MAALSFLELKVATSILAGLALVYWWLKPKPLAGIPHNPVRGILGDIPELARFIKEKDARALDYFAHLIERHGPITQVCLGKNVFLLLSDQEEIDRIVMRWKNVDLLPDMLTAFASVIPTGMISIPANDMWKRHRRIMGPSMHRRYLSKMTQHVVASADAFVKLWDSKVELAGGSAFCASSDLRLGLMEALSAILTGTRIGCLDTPHLTLKETSFGERGIVDFFLGGQPQICQAFTTMIDAINYATHLPFPRLTVPISLWLRPSWRRSIRSVRSYLHDALELSKSQGYLAESQGLLKTDADCVVDMVVQQGDRGGAESILDDEIIDELCIYILAGQDTSTATMSWLVKYMPQDINIQERLHKEVCGVFETSDTGPASITLEILDDIEEMPVLEAVTVETLRCAMVAGIVGRHRTNMLLLTGLNGMSESEWGADVKKWRPSRWLRSDGSFNQNAGPAGNPFGMGHRSCFGRRLAITQLKAFIAALSRAFIFKSVPPTVDSWTPGKDLVNQPKQCYVSLERWES